ncbi:hypothetical protein ACFVWL_10990 [Microbacterium sp. NPDC058269]|jgi:hypothetical protein
MIDESGVVAREAGRLDAESRTERGRRALAELVDRLFADAEREVAPARS